MTQDIDTTNKGNGNKAFRPEAFAPDSVLRPGQQGSEARVILETGKEERGLYFKGDFENTDEVKMSIAGVREAHRHNVHWLEELDKDLIAGKTAVKNRRVNTYATITTGVWGNQENLTKRLFKEGKREQEEARK